MTAGDTDFDRVLRSRQKKMDAVVNVDEPTVKLVVVSLGDQWFAFHGGTIKEILADSVVYFLPGCPASLEGVVNVRGDIESVIRLRALLGLPEPLAGAPSRILLGVTSAMRSGIRVDRVEEVLDVPQSAIQEPPHTIPEHLRPLVQGIVAFRDHVVPLLNLDQLFADYRTGLR
ncbi:MAG TPA: chemotaxis protein CheW [Telmatospirillum sp.]|nr:chemotaxis protein CheW [Telmatospirillum sp.]